MTAFTGMEQWEIQRRVEDKWRCIMIDGKKYRQKIPGRSVIIPGFQRAAFFVAIDPDIHRWIVTESLCGLRIGYPARTAFRAVAQAVNGLWKHCKGDEAKFEEKVAGHPHLVNLPVWEGHAEPGGEK